jgi:hypothetical protein
MLIFDTQFHGKSPQLIGKVETSGAEVRIRNHHRIAARFTKLCVGLAQSSRDLLALLGAGQPIRINDLLIS